MSEILTGGLVDLQVNGFAGIDFNTPGMSVAAFEAALEAMLRVGVTRCLPTLITAGEAELAQCFRALEAARARSKLASEMVLGYHLEGPFISPVDGYRGCHPAGYAIPADLALFERLQEAAGGRIRLVTLAPEVPGALDLTRVLAQRGIVVAIGHSAAARATIREAAAAGARLATHLGNGLARVLDKNDNPLTSLLAEDRIAASFIADGIHIPPDYLAVYVRAKGLARTILVTDAVAGAAAAPGAYRLGRVAIERGTAPVVHVPGTQNLAGSALTLDAAVRNAALWLGLDLAAAVALARDNPLALLGEVGGANDIITWREEKVARVELRALGLSREI